LDCVHDFLPRFLAIPIRKNATLQPVFFFYRFFGFKPVGDFIADNAGTKPALVKLVSLLPDLFQKLFQVRLDGLLCRRRSFFDHTFLAVAFLTGIIVSLVDVVRRYLNSTFTSRPSMFVFCLPCATLFVYVKSDL
jgi:hypothetical protein